MLGILVKSIFKVILVVPLLLGVCFAQDIVGSNGLGVSGRANQSLVYNMLERHFYLPEKVPELKKLNPDDLHRYLVDGGLDRWAKFHVSNSIENVNSQQSVRNDFGLRLIKHNGSFFLLPELGGPNEQENFVVYRVLTEPENGDWKAAISSGDLILAAPNENVRFVKDEYITTGFELQGSTLRIDNFTNNAIGFSIERHAERLPDIRVLDLRFNGGGRVDLADQLLQAMFDEPVRLGYSLTKGERRFYGDFGNTIEPNRFSGLTVLVSRHTASAAEWVARILQHHGAVVVGERTEGKCLIHKVYPVGNRVYFEFATGVLKTSFESDYDYCNYGLVPNLFAYDIPLINENAKFIASLAGECVNAELNDRPDELCRRVFPGVVRNDYGSAIIEPPATGVR